MQEGNVGQVSPVTIGITRKKVCPAYARGTAGYYCVETTTHHMSPHQRTTGCQAKTVWDFPWIALHFASICQDPHPCRSRAAYQ
jgi:hypothetical protein